MAKIRMILWFLLFLSPLASAEEPAASKKALICRKNEVFGPCPVDCPEPKCERVFFRETSWNCPDSKTDGLCCRCAKGFYRKGDDCVSIFDCCDDPFERMTKDANLCPGGTCDNPERQFCYMAHAWYACQCIDHFVKVSNDDPTCVPYEYCFWFRQEPYRNRENEKKPSS